MLYERTLGQWLEHWAETTPDKEYIVYSDRNLRFTWSQFNRRVDDMAKGLIAIGVEYHASGTEDLPTRTLEKRTFPLYEKRHLRGAGEAPGHVQHGRNTSLGRQYRRQPPE